MGAYKCIYIRGNLYTMRSMFLMAIVLIVFVDAAHAEQELLPLSYENVLGGDSFQASGKKINLWGITAPDEGHMLYFTAKLFLETLLAEEPLECEAKDGTSYRCYVDDKDVAANLVLFGLAEDQNGAYAIEEAEAKRNKRGLWQSPISDEL